MARDDLRQEEVDLTADPLRRLGRRAQDGASRATIPTSYYPERWAEVLSDRVQKCESDRERIYAQGGLHVIGTERHEARRIDNQLRGRAGRQGDPGSSRFYISLEDELMRRFGGERLQAVDGTRRGWKRRPLEFGMLGKVIESVQERVEGYNFDIRKHVLEYDNVVNKQREVVYAERRKMLSRDDLHDDLMDDGRERNTAHRRTENPGYEDEWDLEGLLARTTPGSFPRSTVYTRRQVGRDDGRSDDRGTSSGGLNEYYRDINQQLGEDDLPISLRQEETSLQTLSEDASDPIHRDGHRTDQYGHRLTRLLPPWYDQPIRRMPREVEEQIKNVIITRRGCSATGD